QEAGDAIHNGIADAAGIGTHHRPCARHGFDRSNTEWLIPGRSREYITGAVIGSQLIAPTATGKFHEIQDALLARDRPQAGKLRRCFFWRSGCVAAYDA